MNENINLCEILKGHEGETFYSPLIGNITLNKIREEYAYPLMFISRGLPYHFTSDGKYNIDHVECLLFPSKEQRDWNKWIKEHKPKVPKTWSELTKNVKPILYAEISHINDGNYVSVSEDCGDTPIEKSALALLKIHQLIEVGYGGNVTNDYFKNYVTFSIMCNSDGSFKVYACASKSAHIHFHTKEQAEEFLSYPENVQLLKDYFMI